MFTSKARLMRGLWPRVGCTYGGRGSRGGEADAWAMATGRLYLVLGIRRADDEPSWLWNDGVDSGSDPPLGYLKGGGR